MPFFFDHYPYTNFHNINLDWVLEAVKAWGALVEENNIKFHNLEEAMTSFRTMLLSEWNTFHNETQNEINQFEIWTQNYLQNLDVQEEINTKLDEMLSSGVLTPYFVPYIQTGVTEWLQDNITPTSPAIDASLTISGAGADAAITGREINAKVNLPSNGYGTSGKVLRSTGTGTEWATVGQPTDAQTAEAVTDWLNEHPEATTTVVDGSITEVKLADSLKLKKASYYNTVRDMVSDRKLVNGAIAVTLGYYSAGDRGGAIYKIRAKTESDNVSQTVDYSTSTSFLVLLSSLTQVAELVSYPVYSSMLGTNNNITAFIEKNIVLDGNCVTSTGGNIDGIEFNGYSITYTGSARTTQLTVTKSKSGIKLIDCALHIVATDSTFSNISIKKENVDWFLLYVDECRNISISDISLYAVYAQNEFLNTDGIHFARGGENITISNVSGICGDDFIAINANDSVAGTEGSYSNITFSNVVMDEENYSGIRILNNDRTVKNISFDNCIICGKNAGTFRATYQSGATYSGITKNISFNNCVFKNKSSITGDAEQNKLVYCNIIENISFSDCLFFAVKPNTHAFKVLNSNTLTFTCCEYYAEESNNGVYLINSTSKVLKIDGFILKGYASDKINFLKQTSSCDVINVSNFLTYNAYERLFEINNCGRFIAYGIMSNPKPTAGYPIFVTSGTTAFYLVNVYSAANNVALGSGAGYQSLYGVVRNSAPTVMEKGDIYFYRGETAYNIHVIQSDGTDKTVAYAN